MASRLLGGKGMDIVHEIFQRIRARMQEAHGLPHEVVNLLELAEAEARLEFGGQRITVTGVKADPARKAAAVTRDYLSDLPVQEVASRHGISRATMYRLLKRR